jgi:hypothetical protein
MPITPTNPFKGRHYPGEVILLCVRWYLRSPLAYEHVSEILAVESRWTPVAFGAASKPMGRNWTIGAHPLD